MESFYAFVLCAVFVMPILANDICDGSKAVQWKTNPDNCNSFYFCFGSLKHEYRCEKGKVYNEDSRTCVEEGSNLDKCKHRTKRTDPIDDLPLELRCKTSKAVFMPSEESCSKYIDCTTNKVEECPYPFVFDEVTNRCMPSDKAQCGSRKDVTDPCDYQENQCRSAHGCVPCYVRFPSCKGLRDGLNPWVGREGSPYFAVCKNERVVYHDMCDFDKKKEIFNPEKLACESLYK